MGSVRAEMSNSPDEFHPRFRESDTPGLQYIVVGLNATIYEYSFGWAELASRHPMDIGTTMMAYSMSKTITAAAVLQLIEANKIRLDDPLDHYYETSPYGPLITIRHLLCHTSGIPNPIPLRWVHPISRDDSFDERAALGSVLRQYHKLACSPGTKFAYSNIGYWLLGRVVENASGKTFTGYVASRVLRPLGIDADQIAYKVLAPANHATGYLERFSPMNLARSFLIDRELVGKYAGRWLEIRGHYVNGPAFGGLVGSAQGFARFLQDQLRPHSLLFEDSTRDLFYAQQRAKNNVLVAMTLGWHVGVGKDLRFYYKEGGGGGFHCMMRLYPSAGIGTVVMVNATAFDVRTFLSFNDEHFLRMVMRGRS